MLILEGADNLGKTTAAMKLLDMVTPHPVYYNHMSKPNENFNFCSHYKDMMSYFAIQDRFHLSGIVYQNVIDKDSLNLIESWLGVFGTYTVVFYADPTWYEERSKQRTEMFDPDVLTNANLNYLRLATNRHKLPAKVDYIVKVGPEGYVSDDILEDIHAQWYNRLMTALANKGVT